MSTHAGVGGAGPSPCAVAAWTASRPSARGSTPGDGQSSFMASGHPVSRARPTASWTAAVCPEG
eukprot:13944091-Alexandrium_andersonii.AAC.1